MKKIKKGDTVQVILGKDRGKTATIGKILSKNAKIILSELNLFKRHVKKQGQTEGGIVQISKPMSISNVALICPKCKKVTRVGFKQEGNEKVRICKKCQEVIL